MEDKIKKAKRKFQMPDTYVIIVFLMIAMCILTYIIPAGQYRMSEDKSVIPGTFHYIHRNPAGPGDFFGSFFTGLQGGAGTIFLVFLIGGAFQVLTDTGTIDAVLGVTVQKTKENYVLITLAVVVLMSLLGALGVGNNVALAFTPIMITLCMKLQLDAVVAAALMYFASNAGFASSPVNPFTVLLAQNLSGVTPMSGVGLRALLWFLFTGITAVFIITYCRNIRSDPSKSITGVCVPQEAGREETVRLKPAHILNMALLIAVFAVYSYGGIRQNWGISALGTAMMILAFASGIIGGMGPNQIASSFMRGAKTMVYSALLVGFANAINVIMTDANIIHSVIYYLTLPLSALPKTLAAAGMFAVNFLFNFFVPSGSGQCYIVMPLMAPAADILGVTRQVAISAYQLGDGLCNAIIPTSGLLMGTLGIAKVPYEKWLKFSLPATLILSGTAVIFLIAVSAAGWS